MSFNRDSIKCVLSWCDTDSLIVLYRTCKYLHPVLLETVIHEHLFKQSFFNGIFVRRIAESYSPLYRSKLSSTELAVKRKDLEYLQTLTGRDRENAIYCAIMNRKCGVARALSNDEDIEVLIAVARGDVDNVTPNIKYVGYCRSLKMLMHLTETTTVKDAIRALNNTNHMTREILSNIAMFSNQEDRKLIWDKCEVNTLMYMSLEDIVADPELSRYDYLLDESTDVDVIKYLLGRLEGNDLKQKLVQIWVSALERCDLKMLDMLSLFYTIPNPVQIIQSSRNGRVSFVHLLTRYIDVIDVCSQTKEDCCTGKKIPITDIVLRSIVERSDVGAIEYVIRFFFRRNVLTWEWLKGVKMSIDISNLVRDLHLEYGGDPNVWSSKSLLN